MSSGWTGRWYRHTFDYILPALDPAGGIGFADDAITMHQQYSTQWDGFPHSFYSGKMYNGYDSAQVTALGEIWNFEELAKDCEADGVYEFMLIAPPLRIVGGVGSPLSPLAIK